MRFEHLIVAVVFGLIASMIYQSKGRNALSGFLAGMIFGPLGVIFALMSSVDAEGLLRQKIQKGELKLCPYCAEPIKAAAIRCKHCLSDLNDSDEKPKRGVSV
jgi:hypothetical protein